MSADISVARVLLELSGELALRAANIASGVSVRESTKATAEIYENLGDEICKLINETLRGR